MSPEEKEKALLETLKKAKESEKIEAIPAFNKTVLLDKLNKAQEFYEKFSGKPGVNPHFTLVPIAALRKRLEKGETSQALVDAINAIVLKEPKVTNVPPPAVIQQPLLEPKGLNLPKK